MLPTFQDYTIKNILGAVEEKYLEEYRTLTKELQELYDLPKTSLDKPYLLVRYNVYEQKELLERLLEHNKISALNSKRFLVVLDSIEDFYVGRGYKEVSVRCHFANSKKSFIATLPTLLSTDFTEWSVNINFKCIDKIKHLESKLADLQKIIMESNKKIDKAFFEQIRMHPQLIQEASTGKTHSPNNANRKKSHNIILTPEEEKTLIAWISKYVYAIHLYCVKGGRSEYILKQAGISPENYRAREPKMNDEGKCISVDNVSGEVDFWDVSTAPLDIIKKACNIKSENVFKFSRGTQNSNIARLCSVELAKYLIIKYGKYGFRGQKTDLFTETNHTELCAFLNMGTESLKSI